MGEALMTFKYPKARKVHQCAVCGCDITKGVIHHYQTSIFDGHYGSWRAHTDCAEMHWHHNEDRAADDQTDDYLGYGYRGRWPHAITRIELRKQLAERRWESAKRNKMAEVRNG